MTLQLPVDPGFAFDYLAILQVKLSKGLAVETEIARVTGALEPQLDRSLADICESAEYEELLAANLATFELVDLAKRDAIPASLVDRSNHRRVLSKRALQARFWPDTAPLEAKNPRNYDMTKTLFLEWHLGLGDAIICNGLVRALALRYDALCLPAKYEKVIAVHWMFSDLSNVFVVPVRDDAEMRERARAHPRLSIGLWAKGGLRDWAHWDEQFYADAGVSFEQRWSGFHVPECPQVKGPAAPYAFVHQEPARGMAIRQMPAIPVYEPPKPPHIFWNMAALAAAAEIHAVNSCFLNLAESIPTTATRLVVHNYARKDRAGLPTLRKRWEVL